MSFMPQTEPELPDSCCKAYEGDPLSDTDKQACIDDPDEYYDTVCKQNALESTLSVSLLVFTFVMN